MKVIEKKMADGRIELSAVADAKEVEQALDGAQNAFAQRMNIYPEEGKTIAQVAEEKMGITDLDSIVAADALEFLYPFAIDKRNLIPAFPPKPITSGAMKRGSEFEFRLYITLKPQYELKNYDPVKIQVVPFKVDTEKYVADQMAKMSEQYCVYVDEEPRPVKANDYVKMVMVCKQDGKDVENLSSEGRIYPLGVKYMPEGFDENLIGMNVGETKTFTLDAPSLDADDEGAKKPYEFTITITSIQKKQNSVIDDEWVKKNLPWCVSVGVLKDMMASEFTQQQRQAYDEYVSDVATAKVAELFRGSIADEQYEVASKSTLQMLKQNLAAQNMDFNQFVQQNGGEQQFQMMLMLQTRQNLATGFALDAIFRHFNLKAEQEDIMTAATALNPQDPQSAITGFNASGRGFILREMAERCAAQRYVVANAEITYINADGSAVEETAERAGVDAGEAKPEEAKAE